MSAGCGFSAAQRLPAISKASSVVNVDFICFVFSVRVLFIHVCTAPPGLPEKLVLAIIRLMAQQRLTNGPSEQALLLRLCEGKNT